MNRTVVVDFDGTVAVGRHHNDAKPTCTKGAKKALKALRDMGFKVLICSARSWTGWGTNLYHDDMVRWLRMHRIPHDGVVTEKVPALAYVDDRGLTFNDNWSEIVIRLRMRKKLADYQEAQGGRGNR